MFEWLYWLSDTFTTFKETYHTQLLITFYGLFFTLLAGSGISSWIEKVINNKILAVSEKLLEGIKEGNRGYDKLPVVESKIDEFEKLLIPDRLKELEDLFGNLNSLFLDHLSETEQNIKHLYENYNTTSRLLYRHINILESHGNVLSKLAKNKKIYEDNTNEKIQDIINESGSQRKYIHDLLECVKEQEKEIQIIREIVHEYLCEK